ncbi:DNA polymerase ligase N-terminal domain-containing protein [Streptomyces sp. ODS28]|uniref:DNA polymerase ligase N-terminal domain-containing protein n=1 Tax=Streptomyces sp. ODS28 TaxID=3136688 RepID=UPI0031E87F38
MTSTKRKNALATYNAKRRFQKTREPKGEQASEEGFRFVVQIHAATTTHFDFRLEADGVLKSWSVPKGPSTDPQDKRLAMPTEDHPLEYRDFEGVIPEGEYGAGTVIVWDEGTYRPLSHDRDGDPVPLAEALEKGHASFWLDGSKLRGGYALTRFRSGDGSGGGNDREAWLLVKEDDARAGGRGAPDPARARSAHTGRTLKRVAEEEGGDEKQRKGKGRKQPTKGPKGSKGSSS